MTLFSAFSSCWKEADGRSGQADMVEISVTILFIHIFLTSVDLMIWQCMNVTQNITIDVQYS